MSIIMGVGGAALALMLQAQAPKMEFNTDEDAATKPCLTQYEGSAAANSVSEAEWKAIIACIFTNTAAQMDTELPRQVDQITSLVAVSSHGPTFNYIYVLDVAKADVRQHQIDSLKAATRENACTAEDMTTTMRYGGSYFYRWVDRQGKLITTMLIEGC